MKTSDLRRALDPLIRRIRLIVSRAVTTAAADDSTPRQKLSLAILAGEVRDAVERLQQYGLTSNPPEGSEAVCLACGGVRDSMVAVAVDHSESRPRELEPGEVALWMKEHGIRVLLADDGHIDLGTEPSDYVALASPTSDNDSALKDAIDSIVDAINALKLPLDIASGTAGPPAVPLIVNVSLADIAAEEVRAK